MLNNPRTDGVRISLHKLLFLAGVMLCSIGLLMLIPLSKELAYNDITDSNALICMIVISGTIGTLAIFFLKKSPLINLVKIH